MSTTLPPWDQLTFSFGWDEEGKSSLQQCTNVTFQYYDNPGGNVVPNPPPSPPYSLLIYGGGYEPLKVPINNTAMEGSFKWNANLPVGPSYALSIKDAKDYTGGILMPLFKTTAGTCNVSTPMKASSLDVTVSGNSQCGQSIISVNNGTAPYKVEVVPGDDRQQKTMYFATSPFSVVLDMSEGVNYLLAVYDSAGHSSVEGLYTVGSSSDNSCLGSATTVTAGKFSTLYPGGTAAVSSATSTPDAITSKPKLASPAIIGMGVGIPVVVLIIAGLLLWMCYKRNRRQREVDSSGKVEIDQFDPPAPIHSYTPVSTAVPYGGSTAHSGSHYDISNGSMSQHPPAPVPYPHPIDTSDRHTLNTAEASSTSGYDRTSTAVSEKRRQLFTPNLQGLDAEPFDPYNAAGGSSADPSMPPLPPAYSPASRPS